MTGGRQGAVLVVAVLLGLALLLMAHGVLVVSQTAYAASRAHARFVTLDGLVAGAVVEEVEEGWHPWMDSVLVSGIRTRMDTLSAGTTRSVTWRRLAAEAWLVGASVETTTGTSVSGRRLVWILDPAGRVSALPGVISTGPGAPVRLAGSVVAAPPTPPVGTVDAAAVGLLEMDALLDAADSTGASGSPAPTVTAGLCVVSDPWNWGDPLAPSTPCGGHFVLRGARGPVTLLGGAGQGVLAVDGDVRLEGGMRFHGVLVASGLVELVGGAELHGRILAFGGVDVDAASRVVGSRPLAEEALEALRVRLGMAVPLHPALRLGPG